MAKGFPSGVRCSQAFCAAVQSRGQTSRSQRALAGRSDRIDKGRYDGPNVSGPQAWSEVASLLDGRQMWLRLAHAKASEVHVARYDAYL